jgi:ABC-2 type transport system permease protein
MRHTFAGTHHLIRLILRLDRLKLPLWLVGICFLVVITPTSVRSFIENDANTQGITPEAALALQAAIIGTDAATIALQGPPDALDTFGGRYAFEIGAFTFAIIGLMNVLLVARHTRSEEEFGRAELVRAACVGPWSAIAAVSIVAVMANLLITLVTTVVFSVDGIDPVRSLLFGLAMGLTGLVFAAIALIWAQVFEYSRAASGASLAAIGLAFALRAVGDAQEHWISLVSPIGWAQAINPFGDTVYWPFALLLGGMAGAFGIAIALVLRRDVGAGLIDQRPGPATAPSALLSPLGLAWRLQRSVLSWWVIGVALLGAMYGSVLSTVDDLIEQNESMQDILEQMGISPDTLRDSFITFLLSMMALIAGAGVIQSMLRPRTEENSGRAEPVLATGVSRRAWLGSHLLLTALAAPVLMVASGVGIILADGAVSGQIVGLGDTVVAALLRTPALWTMAGLGVLLYGAVKRFTLAVWGVFAVAVFVYLFGDLLQLPDMLLNLSPVRHVTHAPGGDQGWLSITVLLMIAVVSTAGGIAMFERRDVIESA